MARRLRDPIILVAVQFAMLGGVSPAAEASHQQAPSLPRFCDGSMSAGGIHRGSESPRLLPRDEAASNPEFERFLRDLLAAVARRDVEAILRVTDPGFKRDFAGSDGIEFLRSDLASADTDFWEEFPRAVALGGTFETYGFSAPYVYSKWPDEFDPFQCAAVTGTGVRLRQGPGPAARIVTTLAYDIVERIRGDGETPGWVHVRTAAGLSGFVASDYVRSQVDYRARFMFKDGKWWFAAFVAGD
jgi:hypothetical protein